jgi:hypothetical protein
MTEHTIDLDEHRGMAAQKATALRRLLSDVEAQRLSLASRQHELEQQLFAAPAANWADAAEKIRYLLRRFAESTGGEDPRQKTLIANVLEDLDRLLAGK